MKAWTTTGIDQSRNSRLVRFKLLQMAILGLMVVAASPILAGVVVSGFGTASSSTSNGYGDPASSTINQSGLPSSDSASDSHGNSDGNSNGSGAYSLVTSNGPGGSVTISASVNSSAHAQDYFEGGYSATGSGNIAASITLSGNYNYHFTASGSASVAPFNSPFGPATQYSNQSAFSSVAFNLLFQNTTGGAFGFSDSGFLSSGIYGLLLTSADSADVGDFWGASSTGNSEASIELTLSPVPEPSTMVMLGTGLASLAVFAGRRRKQSTEST